jgi:hypothetical protein
MKTMAAVKSIPPQKKQITARSVAPVRAEEDEFKDF